MMRRATIWAGYFFLVNLLIFLAIGLSNLTVLPQDIVLLPLLSTQAIFGVWFFALIGTVGQMTLLALSAFLITCISMLMLHRYPRIAYGVGIGLAAFICGFLILDSIVYHQYRFHALELVWQIFSSGALSQVLIFSRLEWTLAISAGIILVLLQYVLALWIWKLVSQKIIFKKKFLYGYALVFFLGIAYGMQWFAAYYQASDSEVNYQQILTAVSKSIPYYDEIFSLWGFKNHPSEKFFNYPLAPVQVFPPSTPLNIVIIAIDTWRFDMLNSLITPNMYDFAQQAWNFENHYSGGNWTQPGIFSLFYSIPANYWDIALHQKQGPILMDELLKTGYQMGIWASASLHFPAFDQTVFRAVPNLLTETPGNSPSERDVKITQEFQQFLKNRDQSHPFFSFLFYDEVHDWCASSQPYAKPFQPAIAQCDRLLLSNATSSLPYINRYRNAVHFVDQLVGEDLQALKQAQLLKNTVVIITADHGEEFNEMKLNHWGHASDFSPYQVRTPLIVYWPKLGARVVHYQTSHYDIVPTLLTGVLGSTNSLADYSVGLPLLNPAKRPYLIIDSYKNYAVLTNHKMVSIYPDSYNDHVLSSKIAKNVSADLSKYFASE